MASTTGNSRGMRRGRPGCKLPASGSRVSGTTTFSPTPTESSSGSVRFWDAPHPDPPPQGGRESHLTPPRLTVRGADAQAHRPHVDPGDRRRTDRDRSGLRVRLLRHPGRQGAESRGLSGDSDQLEPGHDHDRSGAGRCDLCRADHARGGRQDHRARAPGRLPADHGRPDRAQHGAHARRGRHLRALRRRADRCEPRGDRQGRGSRAVPRGDDADRPRDAKERRGALARRGRRCPGPGRPAGDHPAELHARRLGRRHRLQPRGIRAGRGRRSRRLADHRGPGRGVGARLERVRDGGGPRPGRQLHHRLLDRERRPDGRAHRRQHHGRPCAHPHRQGISAHAQRRDRGAARDRRRHRRLERPVRDRSGRRPDGDHRDEPAGLALLGAGLEGDRVSDRQGRRAPRGGLHARRDHQRHHRLHAGLLRADHRLRGHQGAALHLREVPRDRAAADHLDEVGRRGHGDRADLRRVAAEGAPLARDRARGPGRDRDRRLGRSRAADRGHPGCARTGDAGPVAGDRAGLPRRPHGR